MVAYVTCCKPKPKCETIVEDPVLFDSAGTQTFVVPTDAKEISFSLRGGDGASSDGIGGGGQIGGLGGAVSAVFDATTYQGQTLNIYVGNNGQLVAGPNGYGAAGGLGSTPDRSFAQGGDLSGVFIGAISQSSALLVAGGGGGAGYNDSDGGDAGGLVGETGEGETSGADIADGGEGGTQTGAGAGGFGSVASGSAGIALSGGEGASNPGNSPINIGQTGAGGGGGYFGGGGGGSGNFRDSGGGGGASFVDPSAVSSTNETGVAGEAPSVEIQVTREVCETEQETETKTIYSEEYYASSDDGLTQTSARQLTIGRGDVGQWKQSALRDTPDITIVQGTKSASGFGFQITTGDNGGTEDVYIDTPFTIGIDAPVVVVVPAEV